MKWLLSFVFVIVLTVGSTSSSAQTIQVSSQPVQGCPLVLGDASLDMTVSRGDGALLLKMEPVRYGSCSRFKSLRLISPEGKRLKPRKIKPKRSGRAHISIGVGRRSGGSTGGSIFVSGGPSGYAKSNRITYVFEKGLPAGSLGPGWTWAIKTYDRCTKTREELHIPVDQLVPCEAN